MARPPWHKLELKDKKKTNGGKKDMVKQAVVPLLHDKNILFRFFLIDATLEGICKQDYYFFNFAQASPGGFPVRQLQAAAQEGGHGRPQVSGAAAATEAQVGRGAARRDQGVLRQVRDGAGQEAGTASKSKFTFMQLCDEDLVGDKEMKFELSDVPSESSISNS